MLKLRVITALVLLLVLAAVGYFPALFAPVLCIFFAVAIWECFRLFGSKHPLLGATVWTLGFALALFASDLFATPFLFALATAIWGIRLMPALAIGLPPIAGIFNRLLCLMYVIAIFACFSAINLLFHISASYLFSVMAIVWLADSGAYFVGRKYGKRKLAPTISPGKSWEGALGGWVIVLLATAALTFLAAQYPLLNATLSETFPVKLYTEWGWIKGGGAITLLVIVSVIGDLFESQLKRRIGFKDSSGVLPGHGGVLDRIDALIPVLPLAALFNTWL